MKAGRKKSKAAKPKAGSRIIDLLLVVVSLIILVFVGSFALKFTQGETAPPVEEQIVPVSLRLQVLNGCGIAGAAGKFAKHLSEIGKPEFVIDVIDERNFESFKQQKTLLIARKAGRPVAERLAMKIGLPLEQVTYKELEDNFLDIDYSVVIGADYEKYLSRKVGRSEAQPATGKS